MAEKAEHSSSDDNDNHDDLRTTQDDKLHTHSESIDLPEPSAKAAFSIFTIREKWTIIVLAAMAALFSPLTANSYFPAIQSIADAFHTSVELINVTITVYMVLQGISPMLWGVLSDRIGRRPLFIICLTLLCVACIGLALVPTDAYWLLLLLRCFQAAGSASTIAIGSGTISDIAEPSERGGFLGAWSVGPLIGPCIGPIIGGILAGRLGWRSIFWFLAIASAAYCLFFFLIFPETLRVIVGNGSIPPPKWNRPIIPILTHYSNPTDTTSRPPPKAFHNPLKAFKHPTIVLVLLYNAVGYSVFYGVTATLSELFAKAYPFLNETEIGLCFLSIGLGCAIGSYANGRLLDIDFRNIKRKWVQKLRLEGRGNELTDSNISGKETADFPFEYARLRTIPWYIAVYAAVLVGYGWSIQRKVHISCPLILQFIIGFNMTAMMNMAQTLLLDLYPMQGSSITAANNLVRCTMGATVVSVMDFILNAIKPGWTFTLFAGICVVLLPLNYVVVHFGPRWRHYGSQD